MKLIFKNSLGEKTLCGMGSDSIGITDIRGLSVPTYERQCYSSYDFDGAVESARRIPQRNITISGDIKGTARDVSDFLKLMSEPFKMTVETDNFKRSITVSAANSNISKVSKNITKFALSLVCDDPYFYDTEDTKVPLFYREELLTNETVLPSMFSRRTASASLNVTSDRIIEPKIIITGKKIESDEDGRIVIENKLTGAEFTLLYTPEENEIITVDVKKRSITSDKNGNIISSITKDSYMSDLEIDKNGAVFSLTGYGSATNISAYIIYKNCYLEATA